jgi:hypothetical protein
VPRPFLVAAVTFPLVLGNLLAPGVSSAAIPAGPAGGLRCALHKDDLIDPGLTLQNADIAYRTPEPAPISCTGEINGRKVTRLGTFTEVGKGKGASCLRGAGGGAFTIVVTTDAGPQTINRSYTYDYTALSGRDGLLGGKLSGDGLHGTYDIFPVQGDCAARPMTRIHTVEYLEFS